MHIDEDVQFITTFTVFQNIFYTGWWCWFPSKVHHGVLQESRSCLLSCWCFHGLPSSDCCLQTQGEREESRWSAHPSPCKEEEIRWCPRSLSPTPFPFPSPLSLLHPSSFLFPYSQCCVHSICRLHLNDNVSFFLWYRIYINIITITDFAPQMYDAHTSYYTHVFFCVPVVFSLFCHQPITGLYLSWMIVVSQDQGTSSSRFTISEKSCILFFGSYIF